MSEVREQELQSIVDAYNEKLSEAMELTSDGKLAAERIQDLGRAIINLGSALHENFTCMRANLHEAPGYIIENLDITRDFVGDLATKASAVQDKIVIIEDTMDALKPVLDELAEYQDKKERSLL